MQCGGVDFAHLTWTCHHWHYVFTQLSLMIGMELAPDQLLALLGYLKDIPKGVHMFTASVLLLVKLEFFWLWGSRHCPMLPTWLKSLTYCDTTSENYAMVQLPTARPKDIWQPLWEYLLSLEPADPN